MSIHPIGLVAGLLLLGACASTPTSLDTPRQLAAVSEATPAPTGLVSTPADDARFEPTPIEFDDIAGEIAAYAPTAKPATAQGNAGHRAVNVYLGPQNFDFATQNQAVIGVEWVNEKPDAVMGYEVALLLTPESKIAAGVDGKGWELSVGGRKTFRQDEQLKPYFGGGLNYINYEVDPGDSDGKFGLYAHIGVLMQITEMFGFGLDWRTASSFNDADLGADAGLNYNTLALLFGFSI